MLSYEAGRQARSSEGGVMDRRELLKFFGIGATITPMLDGAPVVDAAATLLAVPSVRPLIAAPFPNGHAPAHFMERLKWNPYEAIWLHFWQAENNPGPGLNGGIGVLEHLLKREPTDQDKAVAAAIMQWFGTSCGNGFIVETMMATGQRVVPDDTLPNAVELRRLQHGNIFDKHPSPSVTVSRRGHKLKLTPIGEAKP